MKKACAQRRYIAALRMTLVRGAVACVALAGVLLLCCPDALALDPALDVSQYAHTAWKVRDGFARGIITSIAQTPDGYLWLGTEFGLLRFDGVRAVPWEPPGDQRLPSGDIISLLAGADGTLWIGTRNGLVSWSGGKVTQYAELDRQNVFALLQDREGTLWAGAIGNPALTGKLCAIHGAATHCYGEDGTLGRAVNVLYEDSKGDLWAGTNQGLWQWKPGAPRFYSLPGEPNGIRAVGEGSDGSLLVGWRGRIWRFVDGKTEAYPLPGVAPQFRPKRVLRDRDGGLWIANQEHGVVHVHEGKIDAFSQTDGLSGDDVNALFEDREGTIWVATLGGLDRFRDFTVATFSGKQNFPTSFGSILADKHGSLWLASNRDVYRSAGGQITVYGKQDRKLSGRIPHSLFEDDRGRIWVCTVDGVGFLENGHFIRTIGIPGGIVHGIAEDTGGNLWIAKEESGLFRLSAQGEVEQIPWNKLRSKDYASALVADPHGGVWFGFFSGGIAYFKDGQVRASYTTAEGLGNGRVNRMRFGSRGTLWAATEGGLSQIRDGHVITLTSKNGLPCDGVHWSIEDNDHFVWLYMPCGLARIARSELDAWVSDPKRVVGITVFDISDGVRSMAIAGGYAGKVAKTSDGKLWFAATDGFCVIDPRHLPFNKLPPPVHIEQVIADRKSYYDSASAVSLDANRGVGLPALSRDLRIDYTALSLVAPEKVMFRYKLEGFDKDWQDVGNRRQAFYTNLPPRNYRFRVMACNNSGVWNEAGTFLDFAVAPAYYQTLWFRLSCVAAFLALLVGLYRLRLRQVAREFNAGLEARVAERTRIARELHDSLLQGFQGLIFRFQAAREFLPGRPNEATEALDIALKRADKVIVEGRDTVSDLRQYVMVGSDIGQALTALGEELAAQSDNGSVPCVRVVVEGKQRELDPMLRDEIYRIGREALRNAFRHARAQKIEAQITYGDSEFVFHVRDDGIGIPPEVASQGARPGHWGLPGMRERAKKLGGQLEVWSEQGAGTEIELTVPAAIAYGGSNARPRFWFLRKKIGVTDGKQS